jgi:hypothetical protein
VHLIIFFFFFLFVLLLLTSSKLLQSRGLLIDPQSLPPGHTHTHTHTKKKGERERERDFALEKNQLVNEEDDRRGEAEEEGKEAERRRQFNGLVDGKCSSSSY